MSSLPSLPNVLEQLQAMQVNIADLFLFVFRSTTRQTELARRQIGDKLEKIFDELSGHPQTTKVFLRCVQVSVRQSLASSIKQLTDKENGWHFSALHATPEQLSNFELEEMSAKMREIAPELCDMVAFLLGSQKSVEEIELDEDDAELWASQTDFDILSGENTPRRLPRTVRSKESLIAWRQDQINMKTTAVMSIMMQSNNQQCNALQSIVGIFLHSCDAPEKVIKTLARMGTSISVNAIHNAVRSLSAETTHAIQELGRSLLAAYAYDNFDVQFNVLTPTMDSGGSNLIHLTSGDLLRLDHGVTLDDLRCSAELWESSPYNDYATKRPYPDFVNLQSTNHLRKLHPEIPDERQHTRRDRFNAWQFLYDLCHHGPDYFHQFQGSIGEPESVEKIPVTKLDHVPARAMDINQSTVSGNLEVIQNLLQQGGVGDPNDDEDALYENNVIDMSEYVVLVHGDLSTYERVQSVMDHRSDEETPWRRFQYVVFVLGLFHLKMAAADTVWRIFISKALAREDMNCLMAFVSVLRASETGRIGSKPKFRQMHEVIRHTGTVSRLDAWRVAVGRRKRNITSLALFAETKPSLSDLQNLAMELSDNFVAGKMDLFGARLNSDAEWDQQLENSSLLHQYCLLYEELTYAMNAGDIGRVETVFLPWIYLFKACGKHKYAAQMTRFLTDVHFRYPEGLRKAVRYNMLVNPTGKPGQFRGVDWVVELNNLFTKVSIVNLTLICPADKKLLDKHSGAGPNHTKDKIITESPLILVYRNCHSNIEKNFKLGGLSSTHADKDMCRTFSELGKYMKENRTNEYVAGRKSAYEIPDMLDEGLEPENKNMYMGAEDGAEIDDLDEGLDPITADDLSVDALL